MYHQTFAKVVSFASPTNTAAQELSNIVVSGAVENMSAEEREKHWPR